MSARAHDGTVQQQLDALDRLARETATHLRQLEAALIVMRILPEPSGTAAPSSPQPHLRLVKEAGR